MSNSPTNRNNKRPNNSSDSGSSTDSTPRAAESEFQATREMSEDDSQALMLSNDDGELELELELKQFDAIDGSVREVNDSSGLKRSSWLHSSTIIVAEIMGTGVMGLPYAAARLGWGLGEPNAIFSGFAPVITEPTRVSRSHQASFR